MKIHASLFIMVPVVCLAQAQGPAITFEKTHHDFGKVGADRKVTYRFKLTNTGKAPLNITRINPACGCTSTVLGKWTLAPGESSEVEASFDPRGFHGVVRKSIQVISDDPVRPTVDLTFEAEVIQEIMVSTKSVFFYDVQRTVPKKSSIRLASGNGKPVQVKEVKILGAPYLTTSLKTEGLDVVLDIDLDGSKIAPGKLQGMDAMTVVTTNEKMPLIPINVQWEMKSFIVSTPERVAWAEAAGKELKMPLVLKHADGKPFRITGHKSSNPLITVSTPGKTGAAEQPVQVILSASAKAGTYNDKVVFTLDDPNQPELVLRVSAILR